MRAGGGWMPFERRFRQYICLASGLFRNYHDLAEMLLGSHPFMSALDVAERKYLVQDWPQQAALKESQQVIEFAHRAHVRTVDAEMLGEEMAQVQLGFESRGCPARNQPALPRQGCSRVPERSATHMLEDQVHPAPPGDCLDLFLDRLFVVVDDVIGAKLLGLRHLLVAAGGRDDIAVMQFRDLNRCDAYAA